MMRLIRTIVLENWSLKITAIFLALVLWLFVRGEPGPVRIVSVPLEIRAPRNMEIANDRPTSVEVAMRGGAFSSMWFNQPMPTCVIVLKDSDKEGERIVALTPDNIRIPRGSLVEVLRVNPARIRLTLERTVSKEVPIAVPIQGELAAGYELYSKIPKPAAVVVTGPRSHIALIRDVSTEAVSISGQKENAAFLASLNIRDNSVRTSVTDPIHVYLQIGPRRKLFTIAQVPVVVDAKTFTATPGKITIQVMAPIASYKDLTAANFSAIIYSKDIDPLKLPIKMKPYIKFASALGSIIEVEQIHPPEVMVRKNVIGQGQ